MNLEQQLLAFGEKPFASPYRSIGVEECKNLYVENSITFTSKVKNYYVSIPGLKMFIDDTSSGICRGLYRSGNRCFGVFGNQFVEILQSGVKLVRGNLETFSDTVEFSDNTYQIVLVDGEFGYIFELSTNTFQKLDEDTFPNGATHITNIDTYFIANVKNSINYQWSDPNNGNVWNPLNFGTKQGQPDNIVALKDIHNQLWVFGQYSTEVHYNTGDITTQVWQRYEGAILEIGCAAKYSVAKLQNNLFWLGADKTGNIAVWTNDGLLPKKVSTRGIEQYIKFQVSDVSKAVGYTYSQAGHNFYIISFVGSNLTLCYDITTDAWHERTYLNERGSEVRWRGFYSTYCFDKNIFGDTLSSSLYIADLDYYQNDTPGNPSNPNYIKRVRTTPIIQSNQKRIRHNSLQILFEQGTGLITENQLNFGTDPVCILECSDDSGHTFTNRRIQPIGKIGTYDFRTRFVGLGHSRNRVYRVTVTDPVKVVLVGCVLSYQELGF